MIAARMHAAGVVRSSACALAACVLAAAGHAEAQPMYRCGNVYSQTPCAANAAPVRARTDAVPDAAPGARGAELCAATATRELQIDAAGPLQIDSTTRAPAEVIQYADKPTATRPYVVALKIKPYVAFDGPRSFTCHLSEDERRVLRFTAR